MRRVIPIAGAAVAAAVALAGCGGGGSSASGTATASGVAGAQTTKGSATGSASFRAQVTGFEVRLEAAVKQFETGNLAGAAKSGMPLLAQCRSVVERQLATRAKTPQEQAAVGHLRTACQEMASASKEAGAGHMKAAKTLAQKASGEAEAATREFR